MELKLDFDARPFIVLWETTQACNLACVHCRACAGCFTCHSSREADFQIRLRSAPPRILHPP